MLLLWWGLHTHSSQCLKETARYQLTAHKSSLSKNSISISNTFSNLIALRNYLISLHLPNQPRHPSVHSDLSTHAITPRCTPSSPCWWMAQAGPASPRTPLPSCRQSQPSPLLIFFVKTQNNRFPFEAMRAEPQQQRRPHCPERGRRWGTEPPFRGPSSAQQAKKAARGGLGRAGELGLSWNKSAGVASGNEARPWGTITPHPHPRFHDDRPSANTRHNTNGASTTQRGGAPLSSAPSGADRHSARRRYCWTAAVGGRAATWAALRAQVGAGCSPEGSVRLRCPAGLTPSVLCRCCLKVPVLLLVLWTLKLFMRPPFSPAPFLKMELAGVGLSWRRCCSNPPCSHSY